MVNVGLSWSSIVGIALAVSGAGLYFLRSVRPGLARDHDIFFAAVALLCGGILFFQGWRQDPILQFGQFMLTGSAIWFAFETIRLRGVATEQAKRTTPVVDDERPVSRVYRAELDELASVDERPIARRIRGTRDARPSQGDDYAGDVRRRPASSRSSDRMGTSDRTRSKRRSARLEEQSPDARSVWDDDFSDDRPTRTSTPRPSSRSSSSSSSRPRRPRPSARDVSARRSSARSEQQSADYVDYQPIDYSDDE